VKLRRLRWRLALLFGVVAIALALVPLLLWRSARIDAIRDGFDAELVGQMETLERAWLNDSFGEVWFPAWFVNSNDEWFDEFSDTELEPPLLTWTRDAEDSSEFRSYAQDETTFRGYVNPIREGEALVTLGDTAGRDADLSGLDRRALLWGVLIAAAGLAVGWIGAGLALAPTRRALDEQQGFLADAAHEMRTPLAVIMASSSQALARPRDEGEYVRSLSEIRSAAERASTGVNELLDLVRFDSGQAIPRLAPLRLDLLAEEVAASTLAEDGGRVVEVVAEPGAPVVVNADMALVRQALDNVVRNAVRRADRVELSSGVDERMGVVEVRDDGPGFDADVLPVVFDRYRRGDRRGETGMGLAIVKAIVEANGGTVTAANIQPADSGAAPTSAVGAAPTGAVVTIRLPLADHNR